MNQKKANKKKIPLPAVDTENIQNNHISSSYYVDESKCIILKIQV